MVQEDLQNLEHLRHSAAHLLGAAVLELWPDAKLTLGPAIEEGFYYDVDFGDSSPSTKDLPRIEKRMKKLAPTWKEFTHREVSPDEARDIYAGNSYKLELIDQIVASGEPITLYRAGNFEDLCRGGHVEEPNKALIHFKLLSVAGAYWRGDEKNTMLTRIYGVAFDAEEKLAEYLTMLAESHKRDHRKLGQQLDLFVFSPLVGSGLPLFTPRGTIIRRELQKFIWSLQGPAGYEEVTIPHLAKPDLYKTSGHWDKFKDDLFHVRGASDEFVIKPMNCPHHTQIYASRPRSYKELPLRFAEMTAVYRDEQAGQLQGLTRVRSITQDDAHVFCRPDQVEAEIATVLKIAATFYNVFGLGLSFRLSLRDPNQPDKYLGSDQTWKTAEETLRQTLTDHGAHFTEAEGEAAFYGPKIDVIVRDGLGRKWQVATIQLDFVMPARFELTYIDEKGAAQAPAMIHRAISGALERFMAILLEHYAGNLPLWLSPTQVAVLPISDDQRDYAEQVAQELRSPTSLKLRGAALRVEVDTRAESIGKKIRAAEVMKVPVMVIVGKKEAVDQTIAVRSHKDGDRGTMPVAQLVQELVALVESRA